MTQRTEVGLARPLQQGDLEGLTEIQMESKHGWRNLSNSQLMQRFQTNVCSNLGLQAPTLETGNNLQGIRMEGDGKKGGIDQLSSSTQLTMHLVNELQSSAFRRTCQRLMIQQACDLVVAASSRRNHKDRTRVGVH